MKIISIQGPQAVGKSTVIQGLAKSEKYNIIGTREFGEAEKRIQQTRKFDLDKHCDFLKNQVFFFSGGVKSVDENTALLLRRNSFRSRSRRYNLLFLYSP